MHELPQNTQEVSPELVSSVHENVSQPDALTPEVMIFFLSVCFLALVGKKI